MAQESNADAQRVRRLAVLEQLFLRTAPESGTSRRALWCIKCTQLLVGRGCGQQRGLDVGSQFRTARCSVMKR